MKYTSDIKLDAEMRYYIEEIKDYFDMDKMLDAFIFSAYIGCYLSEKTVRDADEYFIKNKFNPDNTLEIGRNTLANLKEEDIRYLLICVHHHKNKGVINTRSSKEIQDIWVQKKLNENKALYEHMIKVSLNGAKYLCYEIDANNVTIDAMLDILNDEIINEELEEKFVKELEF